MRGEPWLLLWMLTGCPPAAPSPDVPSSRFYTSGTVTLDVRSAALGDSTFAIDVLDDETLTAVLQGGAAGPEGPVLHAAVFQDRPGATRTSARILMPDGSLLDREWVALVWPLGDSPLASLDGCDQWQIEYVTATVTWDPAQPTEGAFSMLSVGTINEHSSALGISGVGDPALHLAADQLSGDVEDAPEMEDIFCQLEPPDLEMRLEFDFDPEPSLLWTTD